VGAEVHDSRHVLAGLQGDARFLLGVPEDHLEQIVAVRDKVGSAVAALDLLQVERGEPRAGEGVHRDQLPWQHGGVEDVLEQVVPAEQPGRVRGHLQARADLCELLGALEHAHLHAGAAEHQRDAEPADPAAHDDRLVPAHGRSPPDIGLGPQADSQVA
jgi:hypothetical protein